MYEVNNTTIENIKREFIEELRSRGYHYNEYAIDAILDEWYDQKRELIDLLSHHPNWSPERLMVRFDEDFTREIDRTAAYHFLDFLYCNTNLRYVTYSDSNYGWIIRTMKDAMRRLLVKRTFVGEEDAEEINYLNKMHEDFKFRPGQKVTKIMRKICTTFGWDKIMRTGVDNNGNTVEYNAFEREYAKYCDAMCPIKVTRHTCISVNPIDYLLMSNGNSWNSCHDIGNYGDSGCYSSGTISYMLDNHSMIFYTVDALYDGEEIERTAKLQRQVFGYHDNQLLQSRLYPQSNDHGSENIYTDIRNIMQKVIADCAGKPNLWIKRKAQNVKHGRYATCYADWEYYDMCNISVFQDCADKELEPIVLGARPICIKCGARHSTDESISCCESTVCANCGQRLRDEDIIWVDGEPYCANCVSWCECCQTYHRHVEMTWVPSELGYVCQDCIDNYYIWCAECRCYHHHDNVICISEDVYVCNHCLEAHYSKCDECGKYVRNEDITEIVDEETGEVTLLCDECAEGR